MNKIQSVLLKLLLLSFSSCKLIFEGMKELQSYANDPSNQTERIETKLREVSFSVKCMLVDGFNLYDLTNLAKNPEDEDRLKDFNVTIDGKTIFYNFCYDLAKENSCNATSNTQVSASTDITCDQLTDKIGMGNKWKISDSMVEIDLNANPNASYHTVKYQIECNKTYYGKYANFIKEKSYFNKATSNGTFETLLYFESQYGCPQIEFYSFWKFINDFDWLFAIILIGVGMFECILGQKLLVATAFIGSCTAVVIIICIIFFQFILPPGPSQWIIWVILGVSIIIGIIVGAIVAKNHKKCLALLLGGISGFFLGELLFNLFGNKITFNPTAVHVIFIIVCIIVMIILSFILSTFIIILSTSFTGAYMVVRGISFFAGDFPSEVTVIDLTKAGEIDQLKLLITWKLYAYLIAIVLLTIISMLGQFKINREEKKDISLDDLDDDKDDKDD